MTSREACSGKAVPPGHQNQQSFGLALEKAKKVDIWDVYGWSTGLGVRDCMGWIQECKKTIWFSRCVHVMFGKTFNV